MTVPAYLYPLPPAPPRGRRRWWAAALVTAWAVLVGVLAVWSVRHDPPSVPDQRDIAQALPYLDRATGALLAAADGDGRAIVLGGTVFSRDCHLTPVRPGVQATRDVLVHVRPEQVGPAFDAIVAALPAAFRAQARHGSAGTRHDLYADAGGFVAIDAMAHDADTVFTLRAATGCRPLAHGLDLHPPAEPAGTPPAPFDRAVRALGGTPAGATQRQVSCPTGGTAGTVLSGAIPDPADLGKALEPLIPPRNIIQTDPHTWAYRDGNVSIVATTTAGTTHVYATTACPRR